MFFDKLLAQVPVISSTGLGGPAKDRHILFRSGWQMENIGYTPAMLALLEKYIPDAAVTFWPWYHYLPDNELAMLRARFPKMSVVQGQLNTNGKASTTELEAAVTKTDYLLHNSGTATIAWQDLTTLKNIYKKPFGVYDVTYALYGTPETAIISSAHFVYFRDSVSLSKAETAGVRVLVMAVGPDAVFSIDVTGDAKAAASLAANDFEGGKFLCCIPKQRYTPSWMHPHAKGRHEGVGKE